MVPKNTETSFVFAIFRQVQFNLFVDITLLYKMRSGGYQGDQDVKNADNCGHVFEIGYK